MSKSIKIDGLKVAVKVVDCFGREPTDKEAPTYFQIILSSLDVDYIRVLKETFSTEEFKDRIMDMTRMIQEKGEINPKLWKLEKKPYDMARDFRF